MKIYKDIHDLLNGETPHGFGRGIYKNVGCGPWVSYLMKNGKDIYYEDAKDKLPGKCIGVKVGSIVEGSDVEIGPIVLDFPFSDTNFWSAVEEINDEAKFYWERDNTACYQIFKGKKQIGFVAWTEFDDKAKWEGKVPETIKAKWVKWYCKDRWVSGSYVIPKDGIAEFTKGWKCVVYINDITY